MKVKEIKHKVIEIYAMGRDGKLIVVRQYDAPDWSNSIRYDQEREFLRPIIVDGYGFNESLVDILEEREKLKKQVEGIEDIKNKVREQTMNELLNKALDRVEKRKKWYQFWK